MVRFETLQFVKVLAAGLAVALVVGYWLAARRNARRWRIALDVVLVLLAPFSVAAYFDFGHYPKFGQFQNPHDTFHYYMGAKYSREVGYLNLYPCVAIASSENNGRPRHKQIRDMTSYGFTPVASIIADTARYKGPFTAARWQEFCRDVRYFESLLGSRWSTVLQDMGYNATPVWNMIGRAITACVPTDRPGGLRPLIWFDLAWVASMAVAVGWAFGWRNGAFALIFFCTSFWMSYTHIRGGFLRLDWIMALAIGVCLLKRERYAAAGVAVGYAAGSRIFPILFVLGVAARCLWVAGAELRRRVASDAPAASLLRGLIPRRYVAFLTAVAVMVTALGTMSVVADGGLAHWQAFLKKIELHNRHLAPVRIGFRSVFLMKYAYPEGGWPAYRDQAKQTLADHRLLLWSFQALALVLLVMAMRRAEDYEAAALGYVPAFFLTAPTFYYHIMVLVPLLLFLAKRERGWYTAGTVGMFGVSMALLVLNRYMKLDLPLAFVMACLLLGVCCALLAACALSGGGAPRAQSPKSEESTKQGRTGNKRSHKRAPREKHEFDLVGSG